MKSRIRSTSRQAVPAVYRPRTAAWPENCEHPVRRSTWLDEADASDALSCSSAIEELVETEKDLCDLLLARVEKVNNGTYPHFPIRNKFSGSIRSNPRRRS